MKKPPLLDYETPDESTRQDAQWFYLDLRRHTNVDSILALILLAVLSVLGWWFFG